MRFAAPLILALALIGSAAPAQTIVTLDVPGLNQPTGVAIDGSNHVFVADSGNSAVKEIVTAGGQVTVTTLASGFSPPAAIAIDGAGNIFAFDAAADTVYEILAAGGYATTKIIASGSAFANLHAIALDSADNVFVTSGTTVQEILAAGGYATTVTLAGSFSFTDPFGIAVDESGNVFVADVFNETANLDEIPAAGGYATVTTLSSDFTAPVALAVDSADNVFAADVGFDDAGKYSGLGLKEALAAGGYATINTLSTGRVFPFSVALDRSGNVFFGDAGNSDVKEILAEGGYVTTNTLAGTFDVSRALAVDGSGNVFLGEVTSAGLQEILAAGGYANAVAVAVPALSNPQAVAVDAAGNLFVADTNNNAVKELPAAGGYSSVVTLGSSILQPTGIAIDGSDNVFVANQHMVQEMVAASDYQTVRQIDSALNEPQGVALDGVGNLFVASKGDSTVQELTAASGYAAATTLGSGFFYPNSVAVDASGNVFVADAYTSAIVEIPASGGGTAINPFGSGFNQPQGVGVDDAGNVYVADTGNNAVKEVLAGSPVLAAAVLPEARSVELPTPATFFATMINAGPAPLDNCQLVQPQAFLGATVTYQTTDPTTNQPTGSPDTPVTIAGNGGMQSFLIAFQSTLSFDAPQLSLQFGCPNGNVLAAAPILPGVNTIELDMENVPVADIIALAATQTNNSIVEVPQGGAGAFAIATTNLGITAPITVSIDTGAATLPVTATICQTNPSTAQCLAAPTAGLSLSSFAAGSTPTFSVFLQASGPIAFNPAASRIFVRFMQPGAGEGVTSVAIETR